MFGIIKVHKVNQGFGFISTIPEQKDLFFHFAGCIDKVDGFNALYEGELVSFDIGAGQKGKLAINITGTLLDSLENATNNPLPEYVALALLGDQIRLVSVDDYGKLKLLNPQQHFHSIVYVASSEIMQLKRAIDELEYLINSSKSNESAFQDFFTRYPSFILPDEYKRAHPHIKLTKEDGSSLIPDFILETSDQDGLSDLLELKLPKHLVYVGSARRKRFSSQVAQAIAQLREYSRFFDDTSNREKAHKMYGLQCYKPKMFLISGRRGNLDPMTARDIQSNFPDLVPKTYDDALEKGKIILSRMNLKRIGI